MSYPYHVIYIWYFEQWADVDTLIKELQQIEGIQSASKGRFFLSPGLAPTFQVQRSRFQDIMWWGKYLVSVKNFKKKIFASSSASSQFVVTDYIFG